MYQISCPHCGGSVRFARRLTVAVEIRCPHCARSFRVTPGSGVGAAQPVRNYAPPRSRVTMPGLKGPLLVGGGLVLLSVLAFVFVGLFRQRPAPQQAVAVRAPEPAEAPAAPEPAAAAAAAEPRIEWPPVDPDNFPGLPAQLEPVREPVKAEWQFTAGARYTYEGSISSSARLSPVDLGRAARQVLQFVDEKEFQVELVFERRDANTLLVRCTLKRLRGRMRGPSGRVEYDSRDGPGFLPSNEPLAKLVRRSWLVRCSTRGRILRLEWPDGTLVEDSLKTAVRQVTPIYPLPEELVQDRDVVEEDGDQRWNLRLVGAHEGNLVFVALGNATPGQGREPTRMVLTFDPRVGLLRSVHVATSRTEGTGLPRVGRFRPTLKTVMQMRLVY